MGQTVVNIESKLKDAANCRKEGDFTLAASIYQNLLEQQPDNASLHNKLGQVKAQTQDWQEAIASYQRALELGIEAPFWTYKNLGDALREIKQFDQAIAVYRQAIEIESTHPNVYDSLGQVYSWQGNYQDAISAYEQAIELGISNPYWTYQNLGDALTKLDRTDEAQVIYQKAHKTKSNANGLTTNIPQANVADESWLDLHNQGDECFKQKKWEDAIAFYQQAVKLNPDYFWSCYNFGRALSNLQRWERAVTHYQKAIDLQPSEQVLIDVLQELGGLFEKLGEYDQAISIYYRLTDLNPNSPWAFRGLGNVLLKQNKLDQAVLSYQKSLELKPDEYHTYEMLGLTLEQQEKYDAAIAAYCQVLELEPNQNTIQQKLDLLRQNAAQFTNRELQVSERFKDISMAMDVVITPNEVNRHHGTGILVIRMFEQSQHILSIRTFDHYHGEQDFGEVSFVCSCSGLSRAEVFLKVLQELSGARINRILCIPYFPEDVLVALAIKEIFGVKLCTYIMDDQNVHVQGIPDSLMCELLEKSSLLLAISPEVRDAYEQKYDHKFWLLPGIVPQKLLQPVVCDRSQYDEFTQSKRGILVGNIWTQRWLDDLCKTIRDLDLEAG